tara:strand:+ start:5586 stop:8633 length:3048 start_codon:yes stop_codon:yes gene_type:complete
MNELFQNRLVPSMTAVLLILFSSFASAEISFNYDIRPILAANCFECHGPDQNARKAKLRLDQPSDVLSPGKPTESELLRRLTAHDVDERMPPAESKRTITSEQIGKIRQWIQEGAKYEKHWAFIRPSKPELPPVDRKSWVRNDIDRFVLARLEAEGLRPSPEADRYALAKRLFLDLVGLPPTPEEADAFAGDRSPMAYENLVDRLLKSERYGERWARKWLDIARYSDTNGYEKDRERSIWPYRDWVINAINSGMPFDRFTIEQIAGDMLPNARVSQRVATGFHRNTMLNEEGGIDPLEFRFYAMVDRVSTTGTAWLGLTLMCAQCHTHKYDPITHTEYYQIMDYLNNADEPDLSVPTREQSRKQKQVDFQVAMAEKNLVNKFPFPDKIKFSEKAKETDEVKKLREQWVQKRFNAWLNAEREIAVHWSVLKPTKATSTLPKMRILADHSVLATGDQTKRDIYKTSFKPTLKNVTAMRLEVLPHESLPAGGPGFAYYEGPKGDFFLSELTVRANGEPVKMTDATHTYAKNAIGRGKVSAALTLDGDGGTGWSTAQGTGKRHVAVFNFDPPLKAASELEVEMLFERHYPAGIGRYRISLTDNEGTLTARTIPHDVERLILTPSTGWSAEDREQVFAHFLSVDESLKKARAELDKLRNQFPKAPTTLVMQERPADHPRPTFRHHRGEFTQPKEQVGAGIPALFGKHSNAPQNRLEFAKWLVSERNPLTARVVMNRHWSTFFGRGLVRTIEDFGTQSSPPSHPRLLDWLATEFVARGWSMKGMHKWIVMSATYRQASSVTADLLERDPNNVLLARGPRKRIEAEMVRDLALSVSGLITHQIGGPSVFPPQPASVTDIAYGRFKWRTSDGEARFRRSLYTFAKRTAPFAAYLTFDGVSGESCIVRRERSNTPLQALTLLNDQVFNESAQALGRSTADGTGSIAARAKKLLRTCLIRPVAKQEIQWLAAYYKAQVARINAGDLKAGQIVAPTDRKSKKLNQIAAWTMTARAVLNFDETITQE